MHSGVTVQDAMKGYKRAEHSLVKLLTREVLVHFSFFCDSKLNIFVDCFDCHQHGFLMGGYHIFSDTL